jgi:carbamoyltransferase
VVILGINEGINSSVVVCENGQIRFALQEERVTRQKEFVGFPHQALDFSLKHLGLHPQDIEAVCLSNLKSPGFSKEEFHANYERNAEQSIEELTKKPNTWEKIKHTRLTPERKKPEAPDPTNLKVEGFLSDHGLGQRPLVRTHHHFNHAASAYFGLRQNPKDPHLVVTLDGGGDDACAQVYVGEEGRLTLLAETPYGHSLGNLYSRVTHFMGMTPHEHEYKLMGLAAYARRDYCQKWIDQFHQYLEVDELKFHCKLPVGTGHCSPFLARDFQRVRFDNLAGALQFFTEEMLVEWISKIVRKTGIPRVVCAGGVFMNVKANQRLAALPEISYFDVFPSCGDETLPFGAVWAYHADRAPDHGADIHFETFCLGPRADYDLELARQKYPELKTRKLDDPDKSIAQLIAGGAVVARARGPMEFGARALGNRTITADPSDLRIIPLINKMIKQRDFWMPFAPAILLPDAPRFLHVPHSLPQRLSPFMMHTFDSTEHRDEFQAGVHPYDQTSRAQIVNPQSNPEFYQLIEHFKAIKGKGVVLNTSFNLHGRPIVMGACDAFEVLTGSDLTHLVLEDQLVTKA